ncbi:2-dehydropantoate 2-reductase [Terrarubrum flagellatum]|uniref:2-dehydropantoate 2-reductase n=1 Tax=Terrirubrum flagellatum TaxID=2895980 RepID=UPI003145416D
MTTPAQICIFGAGSIGCYIGGRLAAAGASVNFVGRERVRDIIAENGLRLSDFRGADFRLTPDKLRYSLDAAPARGADLVLVTVKSAATANAGAMLADILKPNAIVVSLQNGVGNDDVLRAALHGRVVLGGMVAFNVIERGEGSFHQGTDGEIGAQNHPALQRFLPFFDHAGIPLRLYQDIRPIQWGKLLLNLNNAVNALSGLPLRDQLMQQDFRRCLALAHDEALAALSAARIAPTRMTPLPPRFIPSLLRTPDFLFRIVARRMLAIDPLARSSMADDLAARRKTEVDWLNGEIVRLAARQGMRAPVNERLVELIRKAEEGGRSNWTGPELLAAMRR